jgi:hypothetical protein
MPQHDYHIATQAKFTALNELIEQQAAQIEALTDRNKLLQVKLLDARLGVDRKRIDPQVEPEQQSKQIEALRGFAQAVMEHWQEGWDIDSGDLHNMAVEKGLLEPVSRTEPCGENCACAECGDFPTTCYRKTELLTGAI